MTDALSLEVLRRGGYQRAEQAGAVLIGLDREEGLARLTALRGEFHSLKAALYRSGYSPKEVQAWADGYNEGLLDQSGVWIARLGRGRLLE